MKKWIIVLAVTTVVASGCAKKDNTTIASPTPGSTVQPPVTASAAPIGTNAGGAVTTSPTTGMNGGAAETASTITKEQVEKISMTSTYDDLVKETGAKGKLVKEENGKRSYEFVISNQSGYYAEFVYFANGKISEKRVYQK
ncbi:hypothetical protein [Paenibacillus roseipurpureus]|uniref:PepSY domain-containing protein n=1 Tax=Paenibacillus roseopurpureus TaxID=2918901 RepID=A0AA96LR74_9BACL|nr:hypothetical protein [Paenibacillus sp. MBLB1832]WNR44574.1 hypothetical protein MJB10_26535 [Paenibacillus sp. MBLB1832]